MKFLVSPVSQEQLNDCGDEGLYPGTDGHLYNFCIHYTENEEVVISDNVGRVMPIHVSDISTIIAMLTRISIYEKAQTQCKIANLEDLLDGASY